MKSHCWDNVGKSSSPTIFYPKWNFNNLEKRCAARRYYKLLPNLNLKLLDRGNLRPHGGPPPSRSLSSPTFAQMRNRFRLNPRQMKRNVSSLKKLARAKRLIISLFRNFLIHSPSAFLSRIFVNFSSFISIGLRIARERFRNRINHILKITWLFKNLFVVPVDKSILRLNRRNYNYLIDYNVKV